MSHICRLNHLAERALSKQSHDPVCIFKSSQEKRDSAVEKGEHTASVDNIVLFDDVMSFLVIANGRLGARGDLGRIRLIAR